MIKILFICHGNICRSPMAELVMKEYVRAAGREGEFLISSAAVSREEEGEDIYPPVQRLLRRHGIPFSHRCARTMTAADGDAWDLLVAMEEDNLRRMKRIAPGASEKFRLLMDYTGVHRAVADPYYSGDYEAAWRDITAGCKAMLEAL